MDSENRNHVIVQTSDKTTSYIKKLRINEVINESQAISYSDGEILCGLIESELEEQNRIELDFENIDLITTAFLNGAIGKLLSKFDDKTIKDNISYINISDIDLKLVHNVIRDALHYKDNKKEVDRIFKEVIENG